MSKRKPVRCAIVLLIALVLLVATGYFYWTRGVYVSITNNTQSTLKDINISYVRGVVHVAALEPAASCARYVNPTGGDADLRLEWFEPSGAKHSHAIDVYIEHNYSGSVEITVEPGNRVSVTDKVRLLVIDRRSRSRTYFLQDDANDVR